MEEGRCSSHIYPAMIVLMHTITNLPVVEHPTYKNPTMIASHEQIARLVESWLTNGRKRMDGIDQLVLFTIEIRCILAVESFASLNTAHRPRT